MARNLSDPDNQGGSTLNQALIDEEQKKQQQEQQQEQAMSSQPQLATRSRVSQAGQGTSPTVTAMPKQQQAGTGTFTNLRKYLEAARPASQQRIAQAATQRVMGAAGAAQKGIEQAKTAFGRNVEAGSLANRQQALEQAKGIIGGATGVTYQPPQPVTPPATPAADLEAPAERRLVPLSAGTEPPTQTATAPVTPTTPTPAQQYISPEDQARFAEIINAAYQGPVSLQQAGLYQSAAEKAREAQRVVGDVQTTAGRERILRDIFGRGRDYTQGQSRLDQLLLNTSEQGVRGLQEAAQQAGNLEQAMQQAVRETAAQAAQRRAEIEDIRGQAREAFTTARTGQEEEAEQYIKSIQENWNRLPDYFKEALTQAITVPTTSRVGKVKKGSNREYDALLGGKRTANWWSGWRDRPFNVYNLSPEEAAVLNLTSGTPMFFNPSDISASPVATGEELITKDQLARQLALQQLANLDISNQLKKDLTYTDLEKAGTKDILSSLDTERLQKIRQERQKNFEKELARQDRVIGTPSGYKVFDYLQELNRAGYKKTGTEGLMPENYSRSVLENILKGEDFSSEAGLSPDLIQRMYERSGNVNINQLVNNLQNLQDIFKKYRGTTSQVVSDKKTKARTDVLKKLLGELTKKNE